MIADGLLPVLPSPAWALHGLIVKASAEPKPKNITQKPTNSYQQDNFPRITNRNIFMRDKITTEKEWKQVQDWLNEMTGWAVCEIATHPEKKDLIETWLSSMKLRYLKGERSKALYGLIKSEWDNFREEPTLPYLPRNKSQDQQA